MSSSAWAVVALASLGLSVAVALLMGSVMAWGSGRAPVPTGRRLLVWLLACAVVVGSYLAAAPARAQAVYVCDVHVSPGSVAVPPASCAGTGAGSVGQWCAYSGWAGACTGWTASAGAFVCPSSAQYWAGQASVDYCRLQLEAGAATPPDVGASSAGVLVLSCGSASAPCAMTLRPFDMSSEDGLAISGAVAGVWLLAAAWRYIRKPLVDDSKDHD